MENIDKTTLTTAVLMGVLTFLTFLLDAMQAGNLDTTKGIIMVLLTGAVMGSVAFTRHILTTRQDAKTDEVK